MSYELRLLALAAFTVWLGSTGPAHAADDPPAVQDTAAAEADSSGDCAKCGKCKKGKEKMEAIKADLAAMDERAAELMAAVHAAPKPKRMDAMIALMDELVAQRLEIRSKMAEMHRAKMAHMAAHHSGGKKNGMSGCKMMGAAQSEETEEPAEADEHSSHHPAGEDEGG